MSTHSKIRIGNDRIPETDEKLNGAQYALETMDTGVIYCVHNVMKSKGYIGKAFSYVKNGNQKCRRHGAKDRFLKHWLAAHNSADNDCPIFYEALRNSDISHWFVYTLKVCSKKHLKEWETKLIKLHETSNPKYGYNYFVGDNKPDHEQHLTKYKNAKAESNVKRAIGGDLRRNENAKTLPPNINLRRKKLKDGTIKEHYFAQIKINGKLYNRLFATPGYTQEELLEQAKEYLADVKSGKINATAKKYAPRNSGSKSSKKK